MNQKNHSSSSTPKFTPKAPKRRPTTRSTQLRSAAKPAVEDADTELLLKRFQEKQGTRRTNDKQSSMRVAFGPGAIVPATTTTSQKNKRIKDETLEDLIQDGHFNESGDAGNLDMIMEDALVESTSDEELYREPWNYDLSYYPTTLPTRRPYSGDPAILDELEFGEAAINRKHNENDTNSAAELGLLDGSKRESMLFFQLPHCLASSLKQSETSYKGKELIDQAPKAPTGLMGKLLVYQSGATKLKLGETLYDVYPGAGGHACEDVVAVNYKSKDACVLGQVEKHAVVSLDVNSILDSMSGE